MTEKIVDWDVKESKQSTQGTLTGAYVFYLIEYGISIFLCCHSGYLLKIQSRYGN